MRSADRHGPARTVNDGPVVWQPTVLGRRLADSPCGDPAPFSPFRTEHTLHLAAAIAWWERAGVVVLTEAEIRSAGESWLGTRGHRPDGVLDPHGPGPRGLEVERGRKGPGEWRDISAQYVDSPVYTGRVTWLAAPGVAEPLRRLLETEIPGTGWEVHTWGTAAGTGGRGPARRTGTS
jgi:hypothetical protein